MRSGRGAEFSEGNGGAFGLGQRLSLPELKTRSAVNLVLPAIPCVPEHENEGPWSEQNRNGNRLGLGVGVEGSEVHDAGGLEGEDGDAVVEAEEVDVGADALAWLVDVDDHLVEEGLSVEREVCVVVVVLEGAANGAGEVEGPEREVLEAEAHGLIGGWRGVREPVVGFDGGEDGGLSVRREEVPAHPQPLHFLHTLPLPLPIRIGIFTVAVIIGG